MDELKEQLAQTFGHRIRVRVCGIATRVEEGREEILLARHDGMGDAPLWLPPGGGLEFGEQMEEALIREFEEETGLVVKLERLLFIYEVLRPPFHAIEFFFKIKVEGGELLTGKDPELGALQAISDMKWLTFNEIMAWPSSHKHALFQHCHNIDSLLAMQGHYQYVQ